MPKTNATTEATTLRKAQINILAALSKSKAPLSRKEISDKAKTDLAGLTEKLGSSDPATRKANDKKHFPSLLSLGYVTATEPKEGEEGGTRYSITAAGRKASKQ